MARSALQLRLEADSAYEAYLVDEFRHYPDAVDLYREEFRMTPFVDLYKRRRVLLRPEFWPMLHAASALPRHFIRSPMEWRARGHSIPTLLWSLVGHLYCRYSMPHFWLGEWMREADDVSMSRLQAFSLIAQGSSIYTMARQGMLGTDLSRKECHNLRHVYGVWSLGEAIRMAQVLARGGSRRLGEALGRCAWGEWPAAPRLERRRGHLITWLCQQPPLSGPDIDFVTRAVDVFPDLVFVGRTLASVRAYVGDRQLPRDLHDNRPPTWSTPQRWEPSGYAPMLSTRGRASTVIRELTTLTAVLHEGTRLTHCVASYASAASRGECSLWSLRVGGMSALTIEVRNGAICQIRGKYNRPPTASELKLVGKWAKQNRLRIWDY